MELFAEITQRLAAPECSTNLQPPTPFYSCGVGVVMEFLAAIPGVATGIFCNSSLNYSFDWKKIASDHIACFILEGHTASTSHLTQAGMHCN